MKDLGAQPRVKPTARGPRRMGAAAISGDVNGSRGESGGPRAKGHEARPSRSRPRFALRAPSFGIDPFTSSHATDVARPRVPAMGARTAIEGRRWGWPGI